MKLTAEEKEIAAYENENLIYHMVNEFKNNNIEKTELISAANLGFTRALNGFDKDKGVKLSTFICKCITNEIIRELEKEKNRHRLKYTSLDMDRGDDEEKSLHAVLEADNHDFDSLEVELIIESVAGKVDSRRELIFRELLKGKSQTRVAEELSMSRRNVDYLMDDVRELLKKEGGFTQKSKRYNIDKQSLIADFENGLSNKEIANKYRTNTFLIANYKNKYKKGDLKL